MQVGNFAGKFLCYHIIFTIRGFASHNSQRYFMNNSLALYRLEMFMYINNGICKMDTKR